MQDRELESINLHEFRTLKSYVLSASMDYKNKNKGNLPASTWSEQRNSSAWTLSGKN